VDGYIEKIPVGIFASCFRIRRRPLDGLALGINFAQAPGRLLHVIYVKPDVI
jgi:hypothetical protein